MDDESRDSQRFSYMTEVRMQLDDEIVSLSTMDIGAGGLSVWGPGPAPKGMLKLRLPLPPNAAGQERPTLAIVAEVAREFVSDGGAVWGLRFEAMSDEHRDALMDFLFEQYDG